MGARTSGREAALQMLYALDPGGDDVDGVEDAVDEGAVVVVWILLLEQGEGAGGAQKTGPAAQWRQRFSEEVMRSGVELQATMPLARMTLGQITGLQVGQVIEFEGEAQSQAKLSARQKTLFVCEFGKLGQNYTVRVRHPFDAGHDIIEGLVAAS